MYGNSKMFLELQIGSPWSLGRQHKVTVHRDTVINDVLKDVWFLKEGANKYGAVAFTCYRIIDGKFNENLGLIKLEDKDFGEIKREIKTDKRFSDYKRFEGNIYFKCLPKYRL